MKVVNNFFIQITIQGFSYFNIISKLFSIRIKIMTLKLQKFCPNHTKLGGITSIGGRDTNFEALMPSSEILQKQNFKKGSFQHRLVISKTWEQNILVEKKTWFCREPYIIEIFLFHGPPNIDFIEEGSRDNCVEKRKDENPNWQDDFF